MERKKIGQIQGRISRRRLVCNPTIQHVIINLYTKYDSSSLQGCGEIFDEKVLRNYGRTDGRTDGMTDRCKPVYPPLFQSGGIIKGRTNRRRPIFNPRIQLVVVNLYTRFEVSILNGCGDIFDEKFGKKEKGTNKRKNK